MKFFISSTFEDLKEYRRITIDMLDDLTNGITGSSEKMEFFSASTNTCKEECLKRLYESDVVIGIYGDRYGTIDEDELISLTELEFDKAEAWGKEILAFVSYSDNRDPREEAFIKSKVFKRGKSCGRFSTIKEYTENLNHALRAYFDGFDGFSYSSIWDKVEKAIGIASQQSYMVDSYGPSQEMAAVDSIIQCIEFLPRLYEELTNKGALYNKEFLYYGVPNTHASIKSAAYYLKLCLLQHRLLTEVWTNELRMCVLNALEDYTLYITTKHIVE